MVFQAIGRLLGYPKRTSSIKSQQTSPVEGERLYIEAGYAKTRLLDTDLQTLVALPEGVSRQEWIATNAANFFHHVNLIYEVIADFCTSRSCPAMVAFKTEFVWMDEKGRKMKNSAQQYADYVILSGQKLLMDERVFPTKYGRQFPRSFDSLVQKLFRHLFHVLAHIYSAHTREIIALELHSHLNTLYMHLILFCKEFELLNTKDTAIAEHLTKHMLQEL